MSNIDSPMSSDSMEHECEASMANIDSPMSSDSMLDMDSQPSMLDMDSQPSMSNIDSPMSSDSMLDMDSQTSMSNIDSQPSMEHTSPIHTDGKQKDRPHKRRRSKWNSVAGFHRVNAQCVKCDIKLLITESEWVSSWDAKQKTKLPLQCLRCGDVVRTTSLKQVIGQGSIGCSCRSQTPWARRYDEFQKLCAARNCDTVLCRKSWQATVRGSKTVIDVKCRRCGVISNNTIDNFVAKKSIGCDCMPDSVRVEDIDYRKVPGTRRLYVSSNGKFVSVMNGNIIRGVSQQRCKVTGRLKMHTVNEMGQQTESGSHRFVAKAWIPIPKRLQHFDKDDINLTVDHINGNVTDNRVCNLRWLTRSENSKAFHKSIHAVTAIEKTRKTLRKPIEVFCIEDDSTEVYRSKTEFSNAFDICGGGRVVLPLEFQHNGKKYLARELKAPSIEGEVWNRIPQDIADVVLNGANCDKIKVSSHGRVCGAYGKIRTYDGVSYPKVGIGKKIVFVHRVVAAAFHADALRSLLGSGLPATQVTVDHIDFDTGNNHYKNLRWMSRTQNSGRRQRS